MAIAAHLDDEERTLVLGVLLEEVLRHRLYHRARKQNPQRWSGDTRDWSEAPAVVLNPHQVISSKAAA